MPFYPLLITLFHYVIPGWIRAAQTISWLSMVLAAVPLYKITKILFGWKPAMWSITAYSLAPHFNTYASKIMRDPFGLFMLSLAILFALKSLEEKTAKNFFLASIFSILAFLCRVEYFLFPLFLFFFYFGTILIDRQQAIPLGKGLGVFILIPLCTGIILWLLYSKNLNHIIRLASLKHYINIVINMDFLDGYQYIYQQLKILGSSLPGHSYTGNFAETARHYIWLIYMIVLLETTIILIFPTNIIPLAYKLCTYKYNRNHYFIFGIILLFAGSTYFFLIFRNFIQKRYLIIPVFLLFPWIGSGLHSLYNKGFTCKNGKVLAIALFLIIFIFLPTGKTLSYVGEQNLSLKEAGIWLANHLEAKKDIKLISNDRRIPFFAGLDKSTIIINKNNLQKINIYAQKRKVQIISLAISQKEKDSIPDLKDYEIMKEFHDRKNIVIIVADKAYIPNFNMELK